MKIYLAAPWFSPPQEEIHNEVLATLDRSEHNIFAPRRELEVKPNDNQAIQKQAFAGNCRELERSNLVVAVTDYKDIGTLWECGYAYRCNTPILYYASTLGDRPFNLMLAQSGFGVVRNVEELWRVVRESTLGSMVRQVQSWRGEVQ